MEEKHWLVVDEFCSGGESRESLLITTARDEDHVFKKWQKACGIIESESDSDDTDFIETNEGNIVRLYSILPLSKEEARHLGKYIKPL